MAEKKTIVTAEEFVRKFQAAATQDEAAASLGIKYSAVASRAAGYRKLGVNLKKFPPKNKPKLDIDALNRICANGTH